MVSSHVNFSEQIDLWPPLAGELLNTLTAPLGQSGVEPRPACAGVAERQMVGQEGGSANPAANNKTSNAQTKQSEHFWEASTPNYTEQHRLWNMVQLFPYKQPFACCCDYISKSVCISGITEIWACSDVSHEYFSTQRKKLNWLKRFVMFSSL